MANRGNASPHMCQSVDDALDLGVSQALNANKGNASPHMCQSVDGALDLGASQALNAIAWAPPDPAYQTGGAINNNHRAQCQC